MTAATSTLIVAVLAVFAPLLLVAQVHVLRPLPSRQIDVMTSSLLLLSRCVHAHAQSALLAGWCFKCDVRISHDALIFVLYPSKSFFFFSLVLFSVRFLDSD